VHVEFVEALPRSTIEKLARSRLRERARTLTARGSAEPHPTTKEVPG
jgi:fatty-acyl-CoA synthase